MSATLPPLIPRIDAILVLDGDGNRLAGKYYGDFLTNTTSSSSKAAMASEAGEEKSSSALTVEDLRASFERQLQAKIVGTAARADAAEAVTVMGRTAVFCGGNSVAGTGTGDVRVIHVAPSEESELVLAHLCEGVYDALSRLMSGHTDRNMILDNLEMIFLLIDEHCDGGFILETDGSKLASSVLLRDESDAIDTEASSGPSTKSAGIGVPSGDMTIAQALRQAREQIISNLAQRDNGI
mmetsp:Transcript_17844/g.17222  ORF Transcript_17844/g.17222 Transcript_17844/m.17222 type:complete len:239 (-) Transcript_17844:333-1049(-)|eukprot:CAMPEP_0197827418 /NCGR_PEP_ID=MMETSP1437-20131217/4196_1 /TAXON_ID=49252 ORGANISM="Eucampia antarctica, Strain CCMP1452" /NCGR_SAMPLE_ID=MMETSP1437 /ASSEMBLY_ACC=CAM_ASM_001096 /LENGTH=238 /DNA_ID=CAMNT_0043428247 /DNA_START=164 /DNA_END=880 /DNA_ORIENTATION=+